MLFLVQMFKFLISKAKIIIYLKHVGILHSLNFSLFQDFDRCKTVNNYRPGQKLEQQLQSSWQA